MTDSPELTIVIPVYNEPDNIGPTLHRLAAAVHVPAEALVVYDFDADTTVPVVRALMAELPAVRLLRNDLGRGVLNAMKAGIDAAAGEFVLITMADGSDEVELVDRMVELGQGGADVVAASRYMKGGHQMGGPLLKRTLSRLAELAIELSVKADLAGRRLAELPTTWRDRTAGESRFKLRAWLPLYLRWYLTLFRGRLRRPGRQRTAP
jgi:glycosyltransferase involved in cell wall biosynthesis